MILRVVTLSCPEHPRCVAQLSLGDQDKDRIAVPEWAEDWAVVYGALPVGLVHHGTEPAVVIGRRKKEQRKRWFRRG